MKYTNQKVREQISEALAITGIQSPTIEVSVPPSKEFGDFSTNIAFIIAKQNKENPRDVAEKIMQKLNLTKFELLDRAEVAGAGFINFHIEYQEFGKSLLQEVLSLKDSFGDSLTPNSARIIIEHTSVNPNKPWHIGHARNAILGDTLANLYRARGYEVEVQNYIDDTGKQVADTIFALNYFNSENIREEKFDHFLGNQYVKLHKMLSEEPEDSKKHQVLVDGIEQAMKEIEKGSHRQLIEDCVISQLETAWRLGVYYDLLVWESDIIHANLFEEAMEKLKQSKEVYFATSGYAKGCLVIEMEGKEEEVVDESDYFRDKILIRSNGLPTYTAKDISFQMWKYGLLENNMTFKFLVTQPNGRGLYSTSPSGDIERERSRANTVINVVGFEQNYPQNVVYTALKVAGFEQESKNSYHLSHGHVWLPEGRMSGRKGVGISTDEVIELTVEAADEIVSQKRADDLSAIQINEISSRVAIGAIRFAMLQNNPPIQTIFKLEEVLNFSGYTSLYLQYAYVRTVSLLKKASELFNADIQSIVDFNSIRVNELVAEQEKDLMFLLAQLPSEIERATSENNPSIICLYGFEFSKAFTAFYNSCPVITDNKEQRRARLALVLASQLAIKKVLTILGIPILEKM